MSFSDIGDSTLRDPLSESAYPTVGSGGVGGVEPVMYTRGSTDKLVDCAAVNASPRTCEIHLTWSGAVLLALPTIGTGAAHLTGFTDRPYEDHPSDR